MRKKRKEDFVKWFIMLVMLLVFAIGCGEDLPPTDTQTAQPGTPNLLSATAPSNHYVEVTFSAPVGDEASLAENYTITGPDGTPLPVEAARLSEDRTKVTLTTGSQEPVEYKLTLIPTLAIVNFSGSTVGEEFLISAVSLSNTEVMLLFSKKLGVGADQITSYQIENPNLAVTAVALSKEKTEVLLTTSSQENLTYTVRVVNVEDDSKKLLDPTRSTATFIGIPLRDETSPQLLSAVSTSSTTLLLSFSEPLDDDAADPTFYTITPDLVILDANLSRFNTQVFLTTLPQVTDIEYMVIVSNAVKDRARNSIDPAANSASFTFEGEPGLVDSTTLPRLVGAVSTSNRTVLVTYNKPMGDSALNPQNYPIVQENVNPEVGALGVVDARFFDPNCANNGGSCDRTTVELTTRSQNEVTYRVTAVNVKDLAGNHLAPKEFVAGVNLLNDPTSATFPGTPPSEGDIVDTDGDGLADHEEQRGWVVTVRLATGEVLLREVTGSPDSADTDGDGLSDDVEKSLVIDPRDADTDDDGLTDAQEFNEIFSDPTVQDTDGDGLTDGLEVTFYKTSALLTDTDGDQLSDGDEVNFGNRNPRVADLPGPTIEVGEINLQLNVRFTETTAVEEKELETRNISATLMQSQRKEFSNSNSATVEAALKLSREQEFEIDATLTTPGVKTSGKIGVETTWSGSWTGTWTESSSQETQKAYQKSLTTQVEATEGATVQREVVGARMQATVFLKNVSDLAYSIRNLQLTVFIQDPQIPERLIPIATLLPDSEPAEGFTLGPLVPERGPFIFSNDTIFPNLIERLMQNPRGLVFKIANFDITDEFGRNFAFTSQAIIDRTGTLVIDNGSFDSDGDGEGDLTEYLRVATGTGRVIDTNADGIIDENDRVVVFDANGKLLGITLRDALEAIGLTGYEEEVTSTASLDAETIANSYSTFRDSAGVERLFRVRGTARQDGLPKSWEIITATGIDQTIGLDDFILRTGEDIKLAFVQDLDQDRLIASAEFLSNCSDSFPDTDSDGLDDRFEVLIGWQVEIVGRGSRLVFSGCSLADTDGDGLLDREEAPADLLDTDGDGIIDAVGEPAPNDFVTDPTSNDTDEDGMSDAEEINGYQVTLRGGGTITVTTDPTNPDTDGDTASDGVERSLGGDPTTPDLDNFADADGDGLSNIQETQGWTITFRTVSNTPDICDTVCDEGLTDTRSETADPFKPDTDGDGLLDGEEFALRTNPRSTDTDLDGLTDFEEVRGFLLRDLGVIVTDPLDMDMDNDKNIDGQEAAVGPFASIPWHWIVRVVGEDPYRVFSDPRVPDADLDTLADGDEFSHGTDPTRANTDGDSRDDKAEVLAGLNPLQADFKITVLYVSLFLEHDGDSGANAGDIGITFSVRLPDDSTPTGLAATPTVLVDTSEVKNRLPACNDPNNLDETLCQNNFFGIPIGSGQTLKLSQWLSDAERSISFSMTSSQQFSIEGVLIERDDFPDQAEVHFGGLEGLQATTAGGTKVKAVFKGEDLLFQSIEEITFEFQPNDNIGGSDDDDRIKGKLKVIYIVD